MAQPPHSALSVYVNDCVVIVQPRGPHPAKAQVETLTLNLDTGKIQVQQADAVQHANAGTKTLEALAVLGLCKLHAGNALILATAARPVATLGGVHTVLELAEAQVVASDAARGNRANKGLLKLLEDAVDPQGAGRGLFFSYTYDLTQTSQRIAEMVAADPAQYSSLLPVQRASAAYCWNSSLSNALLAAGAARFVQPLMMGFVQQLPDLQFTDQSTSQSVKGSLTLIARRAAARAGTRQWRRGADSSGAVANYVETEQILSIDPSSSSQAAGALCSYVVVRGSIPLIWTQLPNIKYKPTTVIAPADVSGPAHDKHMASLVEAYKSVVAINLVNQHGTEGKLEAAFRSEAARLVGSGQPAGKGLRYVAFDFHKECGKGRYNRLSVLWDQVAHDFEKQSFCVLRPGGGGAAGGKLQQAQGGVMRVNCIDCLDRTNVVQGVLARKALEAVLVSLGLMAKGMSLPSAYPEVERQFKILWADHGDAVSTQYAGTGAMKSGFTRTGKRTLGGVVDDGVKAVSRYYLNNFEDGHKQDAIDLITGAYQCDTINAPPLKPQPSPLIPIVFALLALGVAAHNCLAVFAYYFGGSASNAAATAAAAASSSSSGLLGSARHLASAVLFNPPAAAVAAGKAAGAAGGISINPTAASVSEPAGAVGGWLGSLAVYGLAPLLLGAGLLLLVVKNGKHLVNKPQLCPQLAVTVAKPPKATAEGKKKA